MTRPLAGARATRVLNTSRACRDEPLRSRKVCGVGSYHGRLHLVFERSNPNASRSSLCWRRAVRRGPPGSQSLRVFGLITRLGDVPAIPVIAAAGAFVLWRERRRLFLVCWLSAFVGGVLVNKLLKLLVHRSRPPLAMERLHVMSFSFPSGHTMAATIGYGMLAYMLATHWRPRRVQRRYIILSAAVLALLVGVSRIYLGVHFPTDVLGGFAAGTAWLAICVTGTTIARQTPAVTAEAEDPERATANRPPPA